MNARLDSQIRFILEIDRLKTVLRRNIITDRSRQENSAEHSWHLALMAVFLAEHAEEKLDIPRVVKMVLVHDLVEIDAGDTFCYDEGAHSDKDAREKAAAERIFGLLPQDQAGELWVLWAEFEEGKTAEAKFAKALDRFQPLLLHEGTEHAGWRTYNVKESQVRKLMGEVKRDVPKFWPRIEENIKRGLASGALKKG